jgi:hypothetical protein
MARLLTEDEMRTAVSRTADGWGQNFVDSPKKILDLFTKLVKQGGTKFS